MDPPVGQSAPEHPGHHAEDADDREGRRGFLSEWTNHKRTAPRPQRPLRILLNSCSLRTLRAQGCRTWLTRVWRRGDAARQVLLPIAHRGQRREDRGGSRRGAYLDGARDEVFVDGEPLLACGLSGRHVKGELTGTVEPDARGRGLVG